MSGITTGTDGILYPTPVWLIYDIQWTEWG
jgi:hypothetical protein